MNHLINGKLKLFNPKNGENTHVSVTRFGKKRKYEDEIGQIFVKIRNDWFKFPEEISY